MEVLVIHVARSRKDGEHYGDEREPERNPAACMAIEPAGSIGSSYSIVADVSDRAMPSGFPQTFAEKMKKITSNP